MKTKKYLCNKASVCKRKCGHGEKHTPCYTDLSETHKCNEKHTMCVDTDYDCICEEV